MNVAIIGSGAIGVKRAKSLQPDDKLMFCVDTDFIKAKILADQYNSMALSDYHTAINSKLVDTVIVSTTNNMLYPIAIEAIKNGKNVLIEKPAGINSSQIASMLKENNKTTSVVMVGFNHRKHPSLSKAKEIIDREDVGEIIYINGTYGHGGCHEEKDSWRLDKSVVGGGDLIEKCCHIIDLSRWFFEMEDYESFSKVNGVLKTYYREKNLEDNTFVTLETKKGQIAQLHSSCTTWKNTFQFTITGTLGRLEINGLGNSYGVESLTVSLLQTGKVKPKVTSWTYLDEDDSWQKEWIEFKDCIKNNRTPSSNLESSLSVMKVVENIYEQNA